MKLRTLEIASTWMFFIAILVTPVMATSDEPWEIANNDDSYVTETGTIGYLNDGTATITVGAIAADSDDYYDDGFNDAIDCLRPLVKVLDKLTFEEIADVCRNRNDVK